MIKNSDNLQESDYDSEAELQEAFVQGLLKPGLHVEEDLDKKKYVNKKASLKLKLEDFKLNLPWIERLDITSAPAPMGPELSDKIDQQKENVSSGKICDLVLNDFEREMTFYRQAQAAVIEGISRLKELKVFTKRPNDYFAEMAKTDEHMQKIRKALTEKQEVEARVEKVRQIRQMRKINRELRKQATLRKESEKKEFLEQVKMYRKKITDNLDFLEDQPKPKPKINLKEVKKPLNRRAKRKKALMRVMKKNHYGYGGKRKGSKQNTKESSFGEQEKNPYRFLKQGWKGKAEYKNMFRRHEGNRMGKGGNEMGKGGNRMGKGRNRMGKGKTSHMKNKGGRNRKN